jgi:outer membrane protein assembly factor BamB
MTRRRWVIAGLAVAAVTAAIVANAIYQSETAPQRKRGTAEVEFDPREAPEREPPPRRTRIPWPTYGYDSERTHLAEFGHRPPFRRTWRVDAHDSIEFPPSIGYGRLYLAQQRGLFFALDPRTGKVRWKRNFRRCAASSPTIGPRGYVYQAYMDYSKCPQGRRGASGLVIAMDAETGKRRWVFRTAPVESTPLLVDGTLYFGTWDHRVYAVDARTGRRRWSFKADEQVNTSGAYWRGHVYFGTDGGRVYAIDARTGRKRWSATSKERFGSREFFYATPTIAYGRVFIGNTDGTMYVYGARSGRLLWARPAGTYIYGAAAVRARRVYFGTYNGSIYALDAATGDTVWKRSAPGAVHAAPTILDGIVYFTTCSSCGKEASRKVKRGPDQTFGVSPRTGRTLWRTNSGKYAAAIVADHDRVYLTGRSHQYALEKPRPRKRRRR